MREPMPIRGVSRVSGETYGYAVEPLESVAEHGPILGSQEVGPDMYDPVRVDPEQCPVIGGMVDLAQGQPVLDDGLAVEHGVLDDVCSVK